MLFETEPVPAMIELATTMEPAGSSQLRPEQSHEACVISTVINVYCSLVYEV